MHFCLSGEIRKLLKKGKGQRNVHLFIYLYIYYVLIFLKNKTIFLPLKLNAVERNADNIWM
jgi:hypothetical protein